MIDKKEVQHIAGLARIGIDEKETEQYSKELSAILDWIKKLEEMDTSQVEPTDHIVGIMNIAREDNVKDFENKKNIVKLFPEEKNGYDKVRSVL